MLETLKSSCKYSRHDGKSCRHNAVQGHDLCILHLQEKDHQEFEAVLKAEMLEQDHALDIEGYYFPITFVVPRKPIKINARAAYFAKGADFSGTEFTGEANFSGAKFTGVVNFSNCKFRDQAFFNLIKTPSEATISFSYARFFQPVYFSRMKVDKAEMRFSETRFQDLSYFKEAEFGPKTNFSFAHFSERADFSEARFGGTSDFSHSTLNALFETTAFAWGTIFERADLENVEFRDTFLGGCLFSNSVGLESCRLSHVRWDADGNRRPWKIADQLRIFEPARFKKLVAQGYRIEELDEIEKQKNRYVTAAETVYRELKANYEAHQNFPDAGHFYYGEMEMRRLRKKGVKRWISILGLYRFLGDYGEVALRPFLFFCFFIVLGTIIFAAQGFRIVRTLPEVSRTQVVVYKKEPTLAIWQPVKATADQKQQFVKIAIYEREVFLRPSRMGVLEHWTSTLGQSFVFSLRVAFLRLETVSETSSLYAKIWVLIEMIFAPFTLSLFILAVGRKVKRS